MALSYGWHPFSTSIILDCLDPVEYLALSADLKQALLLVVSAGQINFREGSRMWDTLHAIFPDGTNTWVALKLAATHEYSPTI
jgi:hypothetical protein